MALIRLKTTFLLAGLAGGFAAPGAAQAQFYFDTWGGRFDAPRRSYERPYDDDYGRGYRDARPLPRGEIRAMLAQRGYRVDPSMARNDDVYLVEAVDPAGRRLRLVVDAYDGTILRRLEAAGPGPAPDPRYSYREDDRDVWRDGDEEPAPPQVIPGVGPQLQKKKAPPPARKPATTARVEPRASAPKSAAPTAPPSPAPAAPPATAPAPSAPGPAAEAAPAPVAQAQKSEASPPTSGPRVIPLYRKPDENAAAPAGKTGEGAP